VNGFEEPGSPTDDLHEISADDPEPPTVDALEAELTGVEDAMALLQKGDVEAAEAAIEVLENPVEPSQVESE